jgi:mannosyltransferase OCH1-like enzyme
MDIIEKSIILSALRDGTIEELPIKLGYDKLPFHYESEENYLNIKPLPKIIHFIWIGNVITDKYVNTVVNCKRINQTYRVILWVDSGSINEVATHFLLENGVEVKNIYEELIRQKDEIKNKIIAFVNVHNNYGYKADILRLYLVYIYGGIYSDIDSIWVKPLDKNFDYDFVTYRIDNQCSNITNSFFGFTDHSFIVKNAILNLELSIICFLRTNNDYVFKTYIPVISGPNHLTRIIKDSNPQGLNYIHQGYCVIGGPHEELYSNFSNDGLSYCYQTFDKNWC